jgi:CRP-like cAMP-binding protein
MKEMKDDKQLQHYLQTYQLHDIFNKQTLENVSLFTFEQGENICRQGQPSTHLYFLVKGKLKIYTSSAEGKTLILSFKKPLNVIGDIEYVQAIETINTVEAVSPVTMIGVPYEILRKHAQEHAPLLQFLLKVITQKFYIKSNSMSLNIMYPVEVRLASYLLSVTMDESSSLLKSRINTSSLTDTANLIGTSYRHLNRVIRKLCGEGLIERKEKLIIIKDRDGLKSLAGENIYE